MTTTIKILLSVLFLSLAALSNAGMDSIQHHYKTSFANNLDEQFWNPEISWKNKYINHDPTQGRIMWLFLKKPVIFTDGWHLIKAFMILFIVLSILVWIKGKWYLKFIYVLAGGLIWGTSFELFYNKKWKKK